MQTNFFQTDSPITLPKEDTLGRSPFAENLARSIMKIRGTDSFVFGISGEWGTGKSSVLNMIEHFIQNADECTPKPIIIHFNPWWFSGRDQLLPMFFSQLSTTIGRSDDSARMKKLGKSIQVYAKALRLFGNFPGTGAFKDTMDVIIKAGHILTKAGKWASKDINQLRNDIDQHLQKLERRVIVFMDDLDRMPPREMLSIFQLVKAVANFPYTSYVLGYDSNIISVSIVKDLNFDTKNGHDYLKKIVNIQFDLPPITQQNLNNMLAQLLSTTFTDRGFSESEIAVYRNYLDTGMESLLQNPRMIKAIINHYRVSIAGVENEVYWPDMLALSVLYITAPEAYQVIANNRYRFLGIKYLYSDSHSETQRQETAKFHKGWIDKIDPTKNEHVKNIIALLFPNVGFSPVYWNHHDFASWINNRRVAAEGCFDSYFQHCISDDRLSEEEWTSFLSSIDNPEVFKTKLVEFSKLTHTSGEMKISYVAELLDRAKAFVGDKDSPQEIAKKILKAFLNNEEIIIKTEDQKREGIFSLPIDNASRLRYLFHHIVRGIRESVQASAFIKDVIDWNIGIRTVTNFWANKVAEIKRGDIRKVGEIDYVDPGDFPLIPVSLVEHYLPIICERLKSIAQDGQFDQYSDAFEIIRDWIYLDSHDEAKEWLERRVSSNPMLFWHIIEKICLVISISPERKTDYHISPVVSLFIFRKVSPKTCRNAF